MTRPILWALGVLAGAALTGGPVIERVARIGRPPAAASAPVAPEVSPGSDGSVTLAQDLSGHFRAHPQVEGQVLRMLVDTGATLCVFTREDAGRIGLRVTERDFTAQVATANGTVPAAGCGCGRCASRDHGARRRCPGAAEREPRHQPARDVVPAPPARVRGRGGPDDPARLSGGKGAALPGPLIRRQVLGQAPPLLVSVTVGSTTSGLDVTETL